MTELIPKVDVPCGESGDWKVDRYTVTKHEEQFSILRSLLNPQRGDRSCRPGTYTRLMHGGGIVMSDTPAEIRDHYAAVRAATGTVLINGLGLGVVLNACLLKAEVARAIVIEISPDVINLVGPHYQKRFNGRLQIIQADAFTWKPPKELRFGMVWHDIWESICGDNLAGMRKLHRKYCRCCDWQGSWCRAICERVCKSYAR